MTPKEKAVEIYWKFANLRWDEHNYENGKEYISIQSMPVEQSKQCAIIAIDEMIKEFKKSDDLYATNTLAIYWKEVKQEIYKL